jgi:uncharacterized protein YcsI (UPF0317 family)
MLYEELVGLNPTEVRNLIRSGKYDGPTYGLCNGYVQCNLVIVPKNIAYDFLLFAQRNPKPCPILEVTDEGQRGLTFLAKDIDIATDIPKYNVYENGKLTGTYDNIKQFWKSDLVTFMIGCSYSFEEDLMNAGIAMRHHEEKCIVPVYETNIKCHPAGVFRGNMVVSMRPIPYEKIPLAFSITERMHRVHGAPVHVGDPTLIGINDLNKTDFGGGVVTIKEGEEPVFWACGVTPQAALFATKPKFVITHTPGHMFIADIKNSEL